MLNEIAAKLIQSMFKPENGDARSGFAEIACPYCGNQEFSNTHFGSPRLISGGNYEGQKVFDIGVRGSVIVLPFWCEEGGHEWVVVLGEHKGCIKVRIVLTSIGHDTEIEGGNG